MNALVFFKHSLKDTHGKGQDLTFTERKGNKTENQL